MSVDPSETRSSHVGDGSGQAGSDVRPGLNYARGATVELLTCWGADGEDFTDLVREKYDTGQVEVFWAEGGEEHWRFVVECSKGHKNVFSGTERP